METEFLSLSNQRILDSIIQRQELFRNQPELLYPWWPKPCTVRVLLLADGGLNFGEGDFGLSTFVSILLNDSRSYVRFSLTLAHRRGGDLNESLSTPKSSGEFQHSDSIILAISPLIPMIRFGFLE